MTTPDTSAVRAWARENGYEVADRGRLNAEVTDAYLAATGGGRTANKAVKKTARQTAQAPRKAAPKAQRAAPTRPAARKAAPAEPAASVGTPVEQATAPSPQAPEPKNPRPKPSPVSDDRRLVALGEEIAALTKRVEALEKAAPAKPSKSVRFRRRT